MEPLNPDKPNLELYKATAAGYVIIIVLFLHIKMAPV